MLSFVFFGTPAFSVLVLDRLEQAKRRPLAVVCQPDRPQGRGRKQLDGPVKRWAEQREIEVLQPAGQKEPAFLERFREIGPDLGLVAAFGQILPRVLLQIPRLGFINVHPSLVPRYRGAAPIQWTLINGDDRGGVSILEVTPGLDDGDILLQESLEVGRDETAEELLDRLAGLGGRLAVRAFEGLERGGLKGTPQSEENVIWAPVLSKADGRIDWSRPALALHNQIRGVQPWPGASTQLGDKRLKIYRAQLAPGGPREQARPGQIVEAEADRILVQTGDGLLQLLELQLEGRKRLDAGRFLLGQPMSSGQVLG